MKKFWLFLFFSLFTFSLMAQHEDVGKKPKKVKVKTEQEPQKTQKETSAPEKKPKVKETKEKQLPVRKPKIAPPGTVMLHDSLYIDVNPIKNIDYREFINFLSVTYSKQVRDSLDRLPLWGINYENFKQFMRLAGKDPELYARMRIRLDQLLSWAQSLDEYLNSPVFNDNPVICVSYNQAMEYALWRTRVVMLKWAIDCKNAKQRSKYYTRIRYRLPTPEEWDLAMNKFKDFVILNKAIFPYNIACTYPAVPQKGRLRFYYVPGNVAEMTLKENLAVGISWIDKDTTANYKKRVEYFAPRDWLGFRCVCEIVEY